MKNDGIATFLNALLALALLASVVLCGMYVFQARAFRKDSARVTNVREWQNLLRAFASDCLVYGQTNSDIMPILESVGWTGKPAAPATPAPNAPAKPASNSNATKGP